MAFTPYSGDLLLHLASYVVLAHRIETDPRGAYETAAEELGVDVSVLRRRMQSLAAWFEVPLTEGRGQQLRLSEAGDAIVSGGSRLLLDIERLRESLAELPSRLSLSYDGALGAEVIPALVKRLRRDDDELTLSLRRVASASALEQLRHGAVDAAVVRLAQPPEGLSASALGDERVLLLLARDHALNQRARLTLRDIARLSLVTEAGDNVTRDRVLERLAPLGASIDIEAESRSAVLSFVELDAAAGLLAALPRERVRSPRGVTVHDVTKLFAACSYHLVHHPDRVPAHYETLQQTLAQALSS